MSERTLRCFLGIFPVLPLLSTTTALSPAAPLMGSAAIPRLVIPCEINNINGKENVDINEKKLQPASEQRYGMSADLGFVIHF
jgi:hypothetical protein